MAKDLLSQLQDVGKKLESPPDSPEELYSLLSVADDLLSKVEQSPSEEMLLGLKPLMNSLVVKDLLTHSDTDVKVAVAACVSEITRITAPEAPYEDDIMKDIFQVIVGAFEGLHDTSGKSFTKRLSVLETVAKVRSCVVMLDLECDSLILEMFQHFVNSIRPSHDGNVFSAMETVMSLVIEESEEISSELLSCLLTVVKKDDTEVMSTAQKLVEQVMGACADKLKPYMLEYFKSASVHFSDYSKVVSFICQNSVELDNNQPSVSGEIVVEDSKLSERTVSDEIIQASTKQEQEVGCLKKENNLAENSTDVVTNGDVLTQTSSQNLKQESQNGPLKDELNSNANGDNPESVTTHKIADHSGKKVKGRKGRKSAQLTDATDQSGVDNDKETPATSKSKAHSEEAKPSHSDNSTAEDDMLSGSVDPETADPVPAELQRHSASEKASPGDASKSPDENLPESTPSKRGRPSRRKKTKQGVRDDKSASSSAQKDSRSTSKTQDVAVPSKDEKEPAGISQSEGKSERRSGKKVQLKVSADDKGPAVVTSDSETKPTSQSGQKGSKRKAGGQSSSGKKQGSEEVTPKDDLPGEPSSKLPEASDSKGEHGTDIVGSKIKVWWPDDKKFYDGIIASYDRARKKHKVVYTDGDVEELVLKKEKWEFIEGDTKNKEKKKQATDASKTGTESSGAKPKGRPRSATVKVETIGSTSKGKTPSSGKFKAEPEKESVDDKDSVEKSGARSRGRPKAPAPSEPKPEEEESDSEATPEAKTEKVDPSARGSKSKKNLKNLLKEVETPTSKSGSQSEGESKKGKGTKKRNKPESATTSGGSSKEKAKASDGASGEPKKRKTRN